MKEKDALLQSLMRRAKTITDAFNRCEKETGEKWTLFCHENSDKLDSSIVIPIEFVIVGTE